MTTLLVVAVVSAGCARGGPAEQDVAAPAAVADPVATGGKAFFDALRPGENTTLVPPPASLAAAFQDSTATVQAEVADVRLGRVIGDPGDASVPALQFVVVELKAVQVLRGALQPDLKTVGVEFPLTWLPDDNVEPTVAKMKADLPAGPAVWLLRWQGQPRPGVKAAAKGRPGNIDPKLYTVVHPEAGVFVQGSGRVEVATIQKGEEGGRLAEVERFAKLSDLVAEARKH